MQALGREQQVPFASDDFTAPLRLDEGATGAAVPLAELREKELLGCYGFQGAGNSLRHALGSISASHCFLHYWFALTSCCSAFVCSVWVKS